ncbi:MAG TPA: hypothetical protein VLJ79_22650 [Candidatus Binatia bacterium]|nr:hypothetical protein [Candidatus Binatia bacterium]
MTNELGGYLDEWFSVEIRYILGPEFDEVIENPGLTSSLRLVSFGSYEDEIQI